jgi:septal ring factor EnvC (AmiA/AmiB activator)
MGYGARSAGAVAALAAALLAFSDSAPAQTRRLSAVRQAERASATAAREAQRARVQARLSGREIAALDRRLMETEAKRAEAEAAMLESEHRLQALDDQRAAASQAYGRDQVALEALLSAGLFEDRARLGGGRSRASRAAFVRAAAADFAAQATARRRLIATTDSLLDAETATQTALIEEQSAIEAEGAELETLRDMQRRSHAALLADAGEADRRAARYAAEARSLADLARRVQAPVQSGATVPLGRLRPPVEGRLLVAFGAPTDAGRPSSGLVWRTAGGAPVAAPARGVVGYAGPFRSYGHILILNLDNGYAIVLAGMAQAHARAGERVQAGQVVGEMERGAQAAPELYVEIRRNGRPIDPSRQFTAIGSAPADRRAG